MRILVIISVLAATLLWSAPTMAQADNVETLNAQVNIVGVIMGAF